MLIFSLYLLALPGITCAGEDNCNDEPVNITEQTAGHAEHEDEKEDCGNFCTCSCCIHIVSVNFQPAVVINNKPLLTNKQLSSYYSISLPSNYFGNIWQPPKMS
ncbi:MAG: hypothetical protein JNM14_06990 [Ferruginibacter sp.]|nr:hypothetical protein [Ferruginibacter sp.]